MRLVLVFRPRPVRQLDGMVPDVDEAGLLEVGPSLGRGVRVGAEGAKGLDQQVAEARERPVVGQRAVVAVHLAVHVLQLDPSTGLQVPTGGLVCQQT